MDVRAVAGCVPGAEDVVATGQDAYRGALRVSVGPVKLRLEGAVAVTERDEQTGRAALRLDATDRAVGGAVRAELRIELVDSGNGTEVRMTTEATLAGRVGDLGQPLIKRQADRMAADFARCLEQRLGAGG